MTPRERRIEDLRAIRQRIDDELTVLQAAQNPPRAKRRMQPLECGSERAYQRHAHFGDTANDKRRVTCEPCLEAHREHERVRAAQARMREAS